MQETKKENTTPGGIPAGPVNPPSAEDGFKVYGGSQTLQETEEQKMDVQQVVTGILEQTQDPKVQPTATRKYFFDFE